MKELTRSDLMDVTWSNIHSNLIGTFKGKEIRSSNFLGIVDDIHPFYLREVNLAEGWATTCVPLNEPEPYDSSKVGTLNEFLEVIRECGVEMVEIENHEVKIVRVEFKKAKIIIYDVELNDVIATMFREEDL